MSGLLPSPDDGHGRRGGGLSDCRPAFGHFGRGVQVSSSDVQVRVVVVDDFTEKAELLLDEIRSQQEAK
jgi:hypothetical protein